MIRKNEPQQTPEDSSSAISSRAGCVSIAEEIDQRAMCRHLAWQGFGNKVCCEGCFTNPWLANDT
jgi:hypothetical protein